MSRLVVPSDVREKPQAEQGLIAGGFFVQSPQALNLVDDHRTVWEQQPLQTPAGVEARRFLATDGHATREAPAGRPVGIGAAAVGFDEVRENGR